MTIDELKKLSGATRFASIFGKSTIATDSEEYRAIEEFTRVLMTNGFGIIHGGYAGGAMSAASDAADRYIRESGLSPFLNIGVPQVQHDGIWPRVRDAQFTEVAEDIFQRLKVVTSGDIAVICPLGGNGTELEEEIVFHENMLRKTKVPMIFFQTENGTDWKKLLEAKFHILATDTNNIASLPWLHFVSSLEDFEDVLSKLH